MIKILIILIIAIVVFDIAIIICGKMSKKPVDRAKDDEEQAEYIRQWRENRNKKYELGGKKISKGIAIEHCDY